MKSRFIFVAALLLVLLPSCAQLNQPLKLTPCTIAGQSAQCGSLPVYENRDTRTGRMIDLKVAVIKSTGPQPAKDPVFLLSGGPGVAATEDTGNIQLVLYIQNHRDVVLVDQRGTGGPNQVTAPTTPDWSGLSPSEVEKAYAGWIKEQLPKLDIDMRYYTTSVAMDDLDEVRQALGYEQINLFGASYGATAAQYYLRQHEQHVRSVVLVSGSLGNIPIWERQVANAQHALDATFSRCESDPACHAAFPEVRTEFAALLERLGEEPIVIEWEGGTLTLTRDLFAAKVEDMTRDAGRAAALPRLIHRAYALDDWQTFGNASWGDWTDLLMGYSIQCNEKWAAFSPEDVSRLGQDSYLLGWNLFRANKYALVCKYLPKGITPEGDSGQPGSQVPVLLFNGELDPLDPPANVAGSEKTWPNSLALTLPSRGHSISDYTTAACILRITGKFIEAASVQNLPTECLQDIKPIPFDTSK
ncbi:MAG TPA: alpha/beta fold hydrolase [Anaerolineales bacterium]|nr:alpha/beta fold hydrolase [Anaerolineales bacterium]